MVVINGLLKNTLIDYPGKMAAEVFLGGCNFRCPFCHNVELVKSPGSLERIPESDVLKLIRERRKWIDGLVVSGGEPTLQEGLDEFIRSVRQTGVSVKLDTNGSKPEVIESLLKEGLLDYIAMDIKAPPDRYREAAGVDADIEAIKRSVSIIMNSGIGYEFRTTLVPGIHTKDDIRKIGEWLKGAKRYAVQAFSPGNTLDPDFREKETFSGKELREFADIASGYFDSVEVRE